MGPLCQLPVSPESFALCANGSLLPQFFSVLWHHLSAVAGVAHRFHSICGKNVTLEEDGTRAVRAAGYAHGLVFSTKELKTEEVFEVGCGDRKRRLPVPSQQDQTASYLPPPLPPSSCKLIFSHR